MTRGDLIAVIITCLYAVLLVGSSEFIQRQFHFPYEFTRKVVHIGTGMWLWAVLVLFDHWQVAVILFAAFTIMNAISGQRKCASASPGHSGRSGAGRTVNVQRPVAYKPAGQHVSPAGDRTRCIEHTACSKPQPGRLALHGCHRQYKNIRHSL